MTTKIPSSILVVILFVLVFSTFDNAQAESRAGAYYMVPTPTPTPEKKIMNENHEKSPANAGPISSQASGVGISMPVRELPKAAPGAGAQEPREINPQNTIPIKTIKIQTNPKTVPAKLPVKTKSVRGTKTAKKPSR